MFFGGTREGLAVLALLAGAVLFWGRLAYRAVRWVIA